MGIIIVALVCGTEFTGVVSYFVAVSVLFCASTSKCIDFSLL